MCPATSKSATGNEARSFQCSHLFYRCRLYVMRTCNDCNGGRKRLSSYLTSRHELQGTKSSLHLRHAGLKIVESSCDLLLNLAGLSPGGRVGSDLVKSLGCEVKSQDGVQCGISWTACWAASLDHVPDMLRVCEYVVRRGVGRGAVRDKVRSYHSNSQGVRRQNAGAKIWSTVPQH